MEHRAVSRHSSFLTHKPTRIASAVSSSQGRRSSARQVPPKAQPSLRIEENSELRRRSAEESPAKFRALGSERLLQFEREGHLCVRGLFDGAEMGALGVAVSAAANKEKRMRTDTGWLCCVRVWTPFRWIPSPRLRPCFANRLRSTFLAAIPQLCALGVVAWCLGF